MFYFCLYFYFIFVLIKIFFYFLLFIYLFFIMFIYLVIYFCQIFSPHKMCGKRKRRTTFDIPRITPLRAPTLAYLAFVGCCTTTTYGSPRWNDKLLPCVLPHAAGTFVYLLGFLASKVPQLVYTMVRFVFRNL